MNNIGGIIRCEILSVSAIKTFEVSNNKVTIQINSGATWKLVPISVKQTIADATPNDDEAGTVYNHQFVTTIPYGQLRVSDIMDYQQCCRMGCVVKYVDANGKIRLLGTKEYPLRGSIEEIPGETAADLAGHRLQLSATCLTPQLDFRS